MMDRTVIPKRAEQTDIETEFCNDPGRWPTFEVIQNDYFAMVSDICSGKRGFLFSF
jgi:hypothetical protein